MGSEFIRSYLMDFGRLVIPGPELINSLNEVKERLIEAGRNGKKIIIAGNGASAAIASHFSVDLTKNAGIRCDNFNEPDLITCFANDYGYEHWIEEALNFYGDESDVFIAISSSGKSKNILNGCKAARAKNFSSVITLSGFSSSNPLRQMGDINLWIDSKVYNFVESIHQLWLLTIVDLIAQRPEFHELARRQFFRRRYERLERRD